MIRSEQQLAGAVLDIDNTVYAVDSTTVDFLLKLLQLLIVYQAA